MAAEPLLNIAEIARQLELDHQEARFLITYLLCADGMRPVRDGRSRRFPARVVGALRGPAARWRRGAIQFGNSLDRVEYERISE